MARALLAVLALLVAFTQAPAAAAREKQVLAISQATGFVHDSIPAAVAALEELGRRSRRYEVTHLDAGVRQLTARRLRRADALVFVNTSGELPVTAMQRRSVIRFVRGGGALVGFHSASDTFHTSWPQYKRLLGAEFRQHPPLQSGTVIVEDGGHPATRSLGGSFSIVEEFYEFVQSPRLRAHVLARLDPASIGPPRTPTSRSCGAGARAGAGVLRRPRPQHRYLERPPPAGAGGRGARMGARSRPRRVSMIAADRPQLSVQPPLAR